MVATTISDLTTLIILVNTFHHISSSHSYTEPLEHYSVQISQPVNILFVIQVIGQNKFRDRVQKNSPLYSCSCSLSYKSLSPSSSLVSKQLSVKVEEIDVVVDTDVEM